MSAPPGLVAVTRMTPASRPAARGIPVLRKGFRPFFLLATLHAGTAIALWVCVALGTFSLASSLGPLWHAHEMLFGYASAVIAGFLLTAVGNWTKRETLVGAPLAGLAALWVAGRIACTLPLVPWNLVAWVDGAFLPALALSIAVPIVRSGNFRNLVMVFLLLALSALNIVMHLSARGMVHGWERRSSLVAVYVVVLLCSIISGRVIPMFTRNVSGVSTIRTVPLLEGLALLSLVATVICEFFSELPATPWVAGVAGLLAIVRSIHWGVRYSLRTPILWVLHLGYLWIPAGLLLRWASLFWPMLPSLPTHAFTVGALGSLTIGMMARVSLGHTGRLLVPSKLAVAAFALVNLAALARVALPLLSMSFWRDAIHVSGTLWSIAALALFIANVRIWVSGRVDGAQG